MWCCLAVILSNKVPTFCTSTYLSIPALSGSSARALLPGGGGQGSLSSAFSLKDMTVSNTFNSKHGQGGKKQKQIQVMYKGGCVRVCVYACAGGGREELGSQVAFFNSPFLCKPNVTRKTEGNAAYTHACRFVCKVLRDKKYEQVCICLVNWSVQHTLAPSEYTFLSCLLLHPSHHAQRNKMLSSSSCQLVPLVCTHPCSFVSASLCSKTSHAQTRRTGS